MKQTSHIANRSPRAFFNFSAALNQGLFFFPFLLSFKGFVSNWFFLFLLISHKAFWGLWLQFCSCGVVHLDILCHTSRFSWSTTYILDTGDILAYKHGRSLRYKPYQSTSFCLHLVWYLPLRELPSRSISRVKLLLVVVVVIVCRLWEQLLRVWPLCKPLVWVFCFYSETTTSDGLSLLTGRPYYLC